MKILVAVLLALSSLTMNALAQAPATAADVIGEWEITTLSPVGENTNTVVISKEGDQWKAVAKGAQGQLPYDSMALDGASITLVLTVDYQGSPMVITYTGTVDGKVMNGAADFGGLAQGSWSAARKEPEKP